MKKQKTYTVSKSVLVRNAKGGKSHKMDEKRSQVPVSKSTAKRLQKMVKPMKRRKFVDTAVNRELDNLVSSK